MSLLIILLVSSCGQNSYEKNLIGKWFEIENEYTSWDFYEDSLVFPEDRVEWQASKSTIQFYLPAFYWDSLGKPRQTIDKILINYQLSDSKDSLFGTLRNNYGNHKFGLLRAENYKAFLKRKYDVQFSLPKDNSAELIVPDAIYGLKVFIGFLDNEIIAKTELSNNLNHLEADIKKFQDSIKPKLRDRIGTHQMFLERKFHLRVFADRNISDSIITEYLNVEIKLNILDYEKHYPEEFRGLRRDTLPIRIYRVFEDEEELDPWDNKGRELKGNAYTVYK